MADSRHLSDEALAAFRKAWDEAGELGPPSFLMAVMSEEARLKHLAEFPSGHFNGPVPTTMFGMPVKVVPGLDGCYLIPQPHGLFDFDRIIRLEMPTWPEAVPGLSDIMPEPAPSSGWPVVLATIAAAFILALAWCWA